jgi:hypothetical protein
VATVVPPRHFPSTIALRRTGATSISRRKPNSRSHTIEPAENSAVNIVDMASTPGNMNVRKERPPVPPEARVERPVPRTNRNSSGWRSDETIRARSWKKRISSRCHTMRTARRSWRTVVAGSRAGAGREMASVAMPSGVTSS